MYEQNSVTVKGSTSTNVVFAIMIAVMLASVLVLLFLFGEWTVLNFLNIFLIIFVAYVGVVKRTRSAWYVLLIGTAVILFSYFFSYCVNADGYFGYIYAIAFAVSMFAFSLFISPRFQAGYGISGPCLDGG